MSNKNSILIDLSQSDRMQYEWEEFAILSIQKKTFFAIWELEAEVNNGGFKQYFFNTSSVSAYFVAEALETISAPKTADICRRAIVTAFPEGLPETFAATRLAAARFSPSVLSVLSQLDGEFFQYPHSLTDLLYEYVSQYPEEFGVLEQSS